MKVWLSKHALRDGYVKQIDAEPSGDGVVVWVPEQNRYRDYMPGQFHASEKLANAQAAKMRDAMVKWHQKRMRLLKAMEFS